MDILADVEEDILAVGEGILTVFVVEAHNLAVVEDILAVMGDSMGTGLAEMHILIVKVERLNYWLFEEGILEMEGMAEYFAGMGEDRLAVVDKGMSMLVVRLARASQNLTFQAMNVITPLSISADCLQPSYTALPCLDTPSCDSLFTAVHVY